MKHKALLVAVMMALATLPACASPDRAMKALRLPPGFKAEIYAFVSGARSLEVVKEIDTLCVSTRGERVYAIDLTSKEPRVFLDGLRVANGIAYKDRHLYIAEQHRIIRTPVNKPTAIEVLYDKLPNKSWHGWRYATFGPDDRLYVSIGAPCNVCAVNGLEGTIIALTPSTKTPEVVASGVRNPVGLAFHPTTERLFFTDNGADYMGDDSPPEELNRLDYVGQHFGYPWYGGGSDRTPDFKHQPMPRRVLVPPVLTFGAHVAPLGLHFYQGTMFPSAYRSRAFVAHHGSWNRSVPAGYQVVQVLFDKKGNPTGYKPFIEGWLKGGTKLGRPVDVAELPDGSLLVSDDHNGMIWRISYDASSK